MTPKQRYKILQKLAYNVWEIYDKKTSSDFNWKKAEEVLKLDQEINGEDFLLFMLEENKEEGDKNG